MKISDRFDLNDRVLAKVSDRRPNLIGRYSVSKIWAINNGYLTEEQYIKGEEFSVKSALRMTKGTMKHTYIEELLDGYKTETKKEMKLEHFTIVGVADVLDLFGKDVCDHKTSDELKQAKSWDEYQVRIYCTMFERPVGYILQPRQDDNNLWLEIIGKVKRNDKWFDTQMAKLLTFHNNLIKNYGNSTNNLP